MQQKWKVNKSHTDCKDWEKTVFNLGWHGYQCESQRPYKKLLKLIAIYSKDTEYKVDTQNITIYQLRIITLVHKITKWIT